MNTLDQLHSGELKGAQQVKLAFGLTEFPRAIFELADTLEILDLSGNALTSLPDELMRMSKLRILFCSNNQFTELPEVLGHCPQLSMIGFKSNQIRTVSENALPPLLRWLILTNNLVEELPAAIGNCARLQKLMLSGNRLRTLPPELWRCSRLELLRIAANQLTDLPTWLMEMPCLSWLAFAGNPFCAKLENSARFAAPTPSIPWNQLQIQHQLGEGASGVIHRAEHFHDEQVRQVAVKLFKGDVTSDGLPRSELNACIAAGKHPGLIPVLGQIAHHPTGANGLVMSLIDTRFRNLASPPSLESCTRDVYTPGASFDIATVTRIAYDVASAACHLHQQGILHGDLYAHNILHDERGHALLGDFGAASFYPPTREQRATGIQQIEVRAFGCLLEELIERCDESTGPQGGLTTLTQLKAHCLSDGPDSRPLFEAMVPVLGELAASCATQGHPSIETAPAELAQRD
ncbi:leucine-rich repeat-containing protein kinase family protein [Acidovorax carolinensis]|uniref:leucine-rich repeat-containing protein kinase family protein n=1 Tax=Acidovorax carolinensis TaxID=553814 RepID=UPI000B341131|nr:leucine-rich repeat-containing protein kinase family protein [Acidovorax carolinensis]ART48761.1 protein kinase [Acidovorax carolinensis]